MVNRNLLREYDVLDEELDALISESLGAPSEELGDHYLTESQDYEPNKIVEGKVREIHDDHVIVDVG